MDDITNRALDGDMFAVQALVVERDALRAERDRLRDGTEHLAIQARELRVEIDRLRAELDALKKQEPIDFIPDGAIGELRSGFPEVVLSGVPVVRKASLYHSAE